MKMATSLLRSGYVLVLAALATQCQGATYGHNAYHMVFYTNDANATEPWAFVAKALNGIDSKVQVSIEKCTQIGEVCDAYCDSRVIYLNAAKQGEAEYYAEEPDFLTTLRYAVHFLGAFKCTRENIVTCTTESKFAEAALKMDESELAMMETNLSAKLQEYESVDNLPTVVREFFIVESLLSELQFPRRDHPTEKEAAFLKWFTDTNGYFGPMMWPTRTGSSSRGMLAHRNIVKGDVLLYSKGLSITSAVSRKFFGLSEPDPEQERNWSDFFQLVAFVATQAELDKSEFAPYIDMLRESVDAGIYGWTKDELQELEDERFFTGLKGIKELQRSEFAKWEPLAKAKGVDLKFEVFQWAYHVVSSRSFEFENRTLVMFMDLVNHSAERGQQTQFNFLEDGAIMVTAMKDVARGEEILIKYSDDIPHLLYAYGFVPKPEGCVSRADLDEGSRASFIDFYKCAMRQSVDQETSA